jgi:hypothetical protein
LLAIFAAQPVRIAAPLFAGLSLSAAEAATILADADEDVRALVAVEAAPIAETAELTPEPEAAPQPDAEPRPEPEASPAAPSISDMVERIERLKHKRVPAPAASLLPPPPRPRRAAAGLGEGRLFEWESDATGHIAWVEGAPRGALVGRPLGGEGVGLLERQAATRLAQRHPFVDVPLAMSETLSGRWSATGVPAFDPSTGRFLGYRGLARRTDDAAPRPEANGALDMDALREMVHEIKTPLNAIIGFAEIIDGQDLGPAHRRYRERAASIVGQARQLLEAVEDLDFAAALRADRAGISRGGARLSELFPPLVVDLDLCLAAHGGILDVNVDDKRLRSALSPELTVRLLRRLLLSLCKLVTSGEVFRVAVTRSGTMCLLTIARPRRLDGLSEAQLVDPSFDPASNEGADGEARPGIGLGFALRLVRGLARVAGGSLAIDEHRITLLLPALDA